MFPGLGLPSARSKDYHRGEFNRVEKPPRPRVGRFRTGDELFFTDAYATINYCISPIVVQTKSKRTHTPVKRHPFNVGFLFWGCCCCIFVSPTKFGKSLANIRVRIIIGRVRCPLRRITIIIIFLVKILQKRTDFTHARRPRAAETATKRHATTSSRTRMNI